jgi:hypothetical protein
MARVRSRSLAVSAPKSTAPDASLLRRVQTRTEGMFRSCIAFCAEGPKLVPLADLSMSRISDAG